LFVKLQITRDFKRGLNLNQLKCVKYTVEFLHIAVEAGALLQAKYLYITVGVWAPLKARCLHIAIARGCPLKAEY